MSIAGGLHLAAERAAELDCDCVQIFTKNNNQWNCKPITPAEATQFKQTVAKLELRSAIAHTSYLINLASPDDVLWRKSIDALVVEWQRAEQLELSGLVLHPGAHMASTPDQGMARIVEAICKSVEATQPKTCRLLLENTAGQGSALGWQFEQLGFMLRGIDQPNHVGTCFDTCHAFAAGYDFRSANGLKSMLTAFDEQVGLQHLHAIHINDSKKGCGSRVDRHEHIGRGEIGENGFTLFIKAKPIKNLPMFLETEKGIDETSGQEWDAINLATLRKLVGRQKHIKPQQR